MTTEEAAAKWNVSRQWVVKLIEQGRIPAERAFGRRTWYWVIPDGTPKPPDLPRSGGRPKKSDRKKSKT